MMFKDELDNRLLYINSVIKEFLPESDNELYKKIIDAACYSVEAGGKRIRPMIMIDTLRGLVPSPTLHIEMKKL